jgi:homoserine kinase
MSNPSSVTVTVPATTANLGPGFDCLGAALSRYNHFHFARTDQGFQMEASGPEAGKVSLKADNLLYQAFLKGYEGLGQPAPAVKIAIDIDIPFARGLGSSATAIVGGVVAANVLAGSPLTPNQVLQIAIDMEGHPDNVVPAFLGGCQLTAHTNNSHNSQGGEFPWTVCDIPWHDTLCPIVAIPNFELSTAVARQVLPEQYPRQDAIFNIAHLGLLLRGLETGREDWLRTALQDRIHQPYRQRLIPGFTDLETAALEAGAYGLVISGAGPTLLALTHQNHQESVTIALGHTWERLGVQCEVQSLALERSGVKITAA